MYTEISVSVSFVKDSVEVSAPSDLMHLLISKLKKELLLLLSAGEAVLQNRVGNLVPFSDV